MGAIQQLSMARGYTLGQLKQADEHAWDSQPEGFTNTVRWNAGHIYVVTEDFLHKALSGYEITNRGWIDFFDTGTSPSTWPTIPPAEEELFAAMKDQGNRISQLTDSQLAQQLDSPLSIGKLITMETVEEVLHFLAWHEGIHAGLINGLIKANK